MTGGNETLVTKGNDAFALLMYENYFNKWTKQGTDEGSKEDEQTGESVRREKKVIR